MEKKIFNFENSITRRDEIVKLLEDSKTPLDESLKLFEEGVSLVRQCELKLKYVEQKATKILESGVLKDFEPKE
ncbi:MAG: exodeoxyribonuclease VII small subunit [Erysipelotrichales bacterium]|nr:exodeoxyribonuclease VII small subunit [Erysipelotrichales bacterium]